MSTLPHQGSLLSAFRRLPSPPCKRLHRAATARLHYGPLDDDDDETSEWAPSLGSLLLTHAVRGVFRQPPPPPPAYVTRRLRYLAKLRGVAELQQEWNVLQQAHRRTHGNLTDGWLYQQCKRAHRNGLLRWATGVDESALRTAAVTPYSAEAAEAYAWRRFLPSHAHHMRIMQEIAEVLGASYAPRRVLDLGCGPGSGLAAAAQIWPDSVSELVGVDTSVGMRVAADILLAPNEEEESVLKVPRGNDSTRITPSVRLEQSLGDVPLTADESAPGFDLAIVSSTLSEQGSDVERAAIVHALWASLRQGGVMIVQEHGGAIGAFVVGAAREQLLDESGVDSGGHDMDVGMQMVIPSPHLRRQCPIAAEGIGQKTPRWLNFAQRVPNTAPARHTGGRPGRQEIISESTSYFAARKTNHSGDSQQQEEETTGNKLTASEAIRNIFATTTNKNDSDAAGSFVQQIVRTFAQGKEEGWWDDKAEDGAWCSAGQPPYCLMDWARIIEPPVKGKRQVTMRLLTPIGTVETLVVSKRKWKAVPGAYAMARRAEWGGLWPWPTPSSPD